MDFYYINISPPCRAVMMAAKALGIEFNMKYLNLREGEHMKPEFLKINPQHAVPTLVDDDFILTESRAILVYLVEKYGKDDALYPKDVKKQAIINQRLYFDMGTLFPAFREYYGPQIFRKQPADPEKLKVVQKAFGFLDKFLEDQLYVAGDSQTIADLALLATVSTINVFGFDFSSYENVTRWYENAKEVTPGWEENWEGCLEFKKWF